MTYLIYNKKNQRYFGNGVKFGTLADVRTQIISYDQLEENTYQIENKSLKDIVLMKELEIQDNLKNKIEEKTLETIV